MTASPDPVSAEGQRERASSGYSGLYENIALYPELGRFRRFAAEWAKLLHDDTVAVLTSQDLLHKALRTAKGYPCGHTVLDCPRSVVEEHYPEIYKNRWEPYEKSLRQYGETLNMSQQIMALPDQASFATRYLAKFPPPILEFGKFGLTQEPAAWYVGPSHRYDSCAWKRHLQNDTLTKRFVQLSIWIEERFRRQLRKVPFLKDHIKHEDEVDLRHHVLVESLDILTCTVTSFLLTGAMFALAYIRPLNIRLGAVGAFGTLFAWSVKYMAGYPSRRIEVYAAIGAFYAVASVFVSNTGSGVGGH